MAKHEGLDPADFWSGKFGEEYIRRNESPELLEKNRRFFELALLPLSTSGQIKPQRVIEFGSNVGMNLRALRKLEAFQMADFTGVDVNRLAIERLEQHGFIGIHSDMSSSNRPWGDGYDFVLCKGVCIHIPELRLRDAFAALYDAANRFIFIAEYFAAERREVPYRGHDDKLWLDDYGGRFWDQYPDLELVDYGFTWKRDKHIGLDNLTWHLFQKPAESLKINE
jgi:pseudaminic acid biosynthesis-associated methylase